MSVNADKLVQIVPRVMLASVYGAVANLEGVIDALALQNRGDTPKTEGGVTLAPHSVYIAVLGGEDAAIAEAMAWMAKRVLPRGRARLTLLNTLHKRKNQ